MTDNVTLRALEPSDADFMYAIENDKAAWRYAERVAPLSRALLRDYALNYDANPYASGQLRLVIVDKPSNTPIGLLDFYDISAPQQRAHIGIYILPDFRTRKYGLGALSKAEDYARQYLGLRLLVANIDGNNLPSYNLFRKAGYTLHSPIVNWFRNPGAKPSHLIIATLFL